MRLTAWLPLAALSALALCGAATRPRYGGTLRVEVRAAPAAFDPAADTGPLASLVFESLIRLDDAGTPQPCLALSWQHEGAGKRWQFTLRPGVKLHDGSPLTPAAVMSALQAALPDSVVAVSGDAVVIRAEHGISSLLLDLAHRRVLSTGPFRLTTFDPGHHATFAANEDYWGGRPFLDAIEVQLGRGLRDQLVDLELGKTDVAEIAPADMRRASEHNRTVWSSGAVNLIALAFAPGRTTGAENARLREALALAINRAAMHSVLLQKQGEATAALLPQWLSGYAFVFPTTPDLVRARALASSMPPTARTITLTYDPSLRAGRSLAERTAVNARDAGLVVQVSPQNAQVDARLVEVRVRSLDPAGALAGLAAALGLEVAAAPATSAALYEEERKLLDGYRVIPLFQLPDLYGAASRVRVGPSPAITRLGDWCFDNVWLSGTAP
jgi:peptide/nickel transport system substrate-binding protein